MKRIVWIPFAITIIAAIMLLAGANVQTSAALSGSGAFDKQGKGKGSWQRIWRMEGSLYDFQAFDENTIMGVGSGGMIVSATDGGVYWHYTAPVDGYDLKALTASANTLWAAGEHGVILKSQDMGKTWEQIDAGATEDILDIFSVGGSSSWIAGGNGLLMRTRDGGASWTTLGSGITTDLYAVKMFNDGMHGIAAGDNGVILLTADGGDSWQQKTGIAPATASLKDIHIFENKAWLVGSDGRVYFSEDQGNTWTTQIYLGFPMTRIEMAPGQDQIGWVVGLDGRLAKTVNGGNSWSANRGDEGYHLYALAMGDTDHIWTGGYVMTQNSYPDWGVTPDKPSWFVWKSADGGVKWSAPIAGLYPWFYNVTAASEKDAYATGQDLQMMKSQDGGYSWREIHSELVNNPDIAPAGADTRGMTLHAISCAPEDPNDCHAAGRNELLLHTKDGGDTWTRESVPGWGKAIYDIAMTSPLEGAAISRNYNYYTEDGIHWRGAFDNGVGRTFLDLDMINSWQGAVSTKKNLFAYTIDAGRHWRNYYIGSYFFYNSGVDALDVNEDGELDYVWLAGCTVKSSVDGPCLKALILFNPDAVHDQNGWKALLLDENVSRLQKIEMVNEESGWAVGFDGEVIFTEDGGVTWTKQDAHTTSNLYGLDVYDRNLAYAAGLNGDIIRYSEPDRRLSASPQWLNKVDGDLSEWNTLHVRHINSDDVDTIVGEKPSPQDLDANVRLRWDDKGLYLGVKITDATLTVDGAVKDKIGIALDGLGDGVIGADDHTLIFSAYGDGELDGSPMDAADYGITTTPDGYAIEAFIPQEALGGAFEHLRKLGVNIALYDAIPDASDYRSQIFWTGTGLNDDPGAFGTLTLFQFDRNQPTQKGLSVGDVTIDGNLDDWTSDETYKLNSASADSVQGEYPVNDADLSADFRMRWWKDYLFLGVNVYDDVMVEGDSVLLSVDVDGDSRPGADDFTLRIWPDGRITINDAPGGPVLAKGMITPDGYQLEAAIPASMLGGELASNQKLHLNYGLLDFDGATEAFDTAMNWQGASIAGVQADFGWLEFVPLSLLIKTERNDPRFQDTYISEWRPTDNFGYLQTLNIRPGNIESPLIRFDVNEMLPEKAEISLSYLGIYTVNSRYTMTAKIYRLLRDWEESQATWQQAATGQPWEVAGAKGAQDQAQTPTDEQKLALSSDDGSCGDRNATWFTITKDVNDFVNGNAENFGWVLRGDAGSQINYALASSQHKNPDCLPEMYFEYTLPSGMVPTPTPVATPTPTMQYLYLPMVSP